MCLIAASRVKRASEPIKVYKQLIKVKPLEGGVRYFSPFQHIEYFLGEQVSVDHFGNASSQNYNFPRLSIRKGSGIYQGIHAYQTITRTLRGDEVVVECEIPADTLYVLGEDNEIVSLSLILKRVVPFYGELETQNEYYRWKAIGVNFPDSW